MTDGHPAPFGDGGERDRKKLRRGTSGSGDAGEVLAVAGVDLQHVALVDEEGHAHHVAGLHRGRLGGARDGVAAAIGQTPKGWCGQDFNESADTPSLLTSTGFQYTTDWANDDRPFLLDHGLVALPPQPEWNDLECMWLRRVPPPVWADNIVEAFAFLHDEGGASFNLTLHPWIAGHAHRIRWLREALTRVLGMPGVWRATTDEVAAKAREQL